MSVHNSYLVIDLKKKKKQYIFMSLCDAKNEVSCLIQDRDKILKICNSCSSQQKHFHRKSNTLSMASIDTSIAKIVTGNA